MSGSRDRGSSSLDSDIAGTGPGIARPTSGGTGMSHGNESLRSDMAATGAGAGEDVEIDETRRLISSDKVTSTAVYNRNGDTLGSIYGLMIDKISGRVAYAVMSFGGFLGIGERYHPLPWGTLTYDTARGGYVVDLTQDQLEGAPSYGRDDDVWSRPGYGQTVHDYYGVPYVM
jgi:hypothetical protein